MGQNSQLYGEGQGIQSFLLPQLEREAQNPTGFSSAQLGSQLSALESGAGGSNSGIVGQGALNTARTRNTAGMSNVLDQAARDKAQAFSQGSLGIQNQNANLEQEKQQSALSQLGGMFGSDTNAAMNALGTATGGAGTLAKLPTPGSGFTTFMNGMMGSGGGGSIPGLPAMGGTAGNAMSFMGL